MIQSLDDLENFYSQRDPWGYEKSPFDIRRKQELFSVIPNKKKLTYLDIGCGDGFITFDLQGYSVLGVDISENAIKHAEKKRSGLVETDQRRFKFIASSIFDLYARKDLGEFDVVMITGVLYEQYIGRALSLVPIIVDRVLKKGGLLAAVHINEWYKAPFSYSRVEHCFYPYREYTHRLEVYRK